VNFDGICSSSRFQGQVQEVVGVMKKNIDRLLDRDVALNNLMVRAEDLETSASTYNQTTKQLRRKYWWKNTKVYTFLSFFTFFFIEILFLDQCLHCWYCNRSYSHYHL
jgi:hypothetical protein